MFRCALRSESRSRLLSKASSPVAQEQRYGKAKGVSGTVKMSDVRDSLLQAEEEKVRLSSNLPPLLEPWSLATGVTEHAPTPENATPPRPLALFTGFPPHLVPSGGPCE